jgi:hypothetical protein
MYCSKLTNKSVFELCRFSTWENIDVRPPLFTGLKKVLYNINNVALIFNPYRYRQLAVATLMVLAGEGTTCKINQRPMQHCQLHCGYFDQHFFITSCTCCGNFSSLYRYYN